MTAPPVNPFRVDEHAFRLIGWRPHSGPAWTWRGMGYDEGWDDVTREDLIAVRDFIDAWLEDHP